MHCPRYVLARLAARLHSHSDVRQRRPRPFSTPRPRRLHRPQRRIGFRHAVENDLPQASHRKARGATDGSQMKHRFLLSVSTRVSSVASVFLHAGLREIYFLPAALDSLCAFASLAIFASKNRSGQELLTGPCQQQVRLEPSAAVAYHPPPRSPAPSRTRLAWPFAFDTH